MGDLIPTRRCERIGAARDCDDVMIGRARGTPRGFSRKCSNMLLPGGTNALQTRSSPVTLRLYREINAATSPTMWENEQSLAGFRIGVGTAARSRTVTRRESPVKCRKSRSACLRTVPAVLGVDRGSVGAPETRPRPCVPADLSVSKQTLRRT